MEAGRDTTAKSRAEAIGKAGELVERWSSGTPTALGSSCGSVLVAPYLDPGRRPARGRAWSERHRGEQESYCRRFVTPVVGDVPVRTLTRVLLVACSGMCWGEHAALTAERLDLARRRTTIDRQVIETRHGLKLAPPKTDGGAPCSGPHTRWCRPRRPRRTPARRVARRRAAVPVTQRALGSAIELPAQPVRPRRRHRAWPRRSDGRWQWTFHSLRHVFATWALAQSGARIEDVSRVLGHSTVRVPQDLYIALDADLYDRYYQATG